MSTTKSTKGLRDEWSLLLHSFLDEGSEKQALIERMKASELSLDEIKLIKKELSSKRKKMNQSIEKIKIKIEQVNNVIENLKLVGSDSSGLIREIDFLHNEGEKISEEVMTLDQKIKKLHELQDDLVSA
jgi:methyl-accepting chemotaxis protein